MYNNVTTNRENQIEKTKEKGIVKSVDFLKKVESLNYDGFENVDQELLIMPYLRIAQPISPQVLEGDAAYIERLKPGMFFNSITGNIYGSEIKIIILAFDRKYLEWGEGMGAYKGSYDPGEVTRLEKMGAIVKNGFIYKTADSVIVETHTFLCLLPDYLDEGLLLYSLKSTGLKYSKKWLTKARNETYKISNEIKKSPIFFTVWKVSTISEKGEKGTWFAIGDKKSDTIRKIGSIVEGEYEYLQDNVYQAADFAKQIKESKIDYSTIEKETQNDDEVYDLR